MSFSLAASFVPNFSAQFVARILSFVLNVYLIKTVDLSLLGIVNVSLTLYYTTVIFLVREPFRRTFTSISVPISSIFDHFWLCPLLCPLVAFLLCFLWLSSSWPDSVASPGWALFSFGLSAWLESLAEPFVVLCLRHAENLQFAVLQSLQIVLQRIFIVVLINATWLPHMHIFCYAQVFASFVYLLASVRFARWHLRPGEKDSSGSYLVGGIFPAFKPTFAKREVKTFSSLLYHSVSKHFATEGASFVLTFAANMPHESQAIYDAIDKIGSLVVRIVLTPLDDSAKTCFSSSLKRGEGIETQERSNVRNATETLMHLLHLALLSGLTACTFAIPFSPLAVWLYGGQKFIDNSADGILRAYCVYVVIIAINGITEGFAMSTMDDRQTLRHGNFLAVASVAQFITSALASRFIGAYGILLGNSLAMLLRIGYNWRLIRRYLRGTVKFASTLPSFTMIVLLVFAFSASSLSYLLFGRENGIVHNAAHVAIGGVLFVFIGNYIFQNDDALAWFLREYSGHLRHE